MRQTSQTSTASAAAIWRVLTTPELIRQWMTGIENLRTRDGGVLQAGSSLQFDARGETHSSAVSALEPNAVLVLSTSQGAVTAQYRYLLTIEGETTRLTLEINAGATGVMGWFSGLLEWIMMTTDGKQVANILALAEKPATGD